VLREIGFLPKICDISPVESSYLNTDMCKFESSQKDESRAQSADFSKANRKLGALNRVNCKLLYRKAQQHGQQDCVVQIWVANKF